MLLKEPLLGANGAGFTIPYLSFGLIVCVCGQEKRYGRLPGEGVQHIVNSVFCETGN